MFILYIASCSLSCLIRSKAFSQSKNVKNTLLPDLSAASFHQLPSEDYFVAPIKLANVSLFKHVIVCVSYSLKTLHIFHARNGKDVESFEEEKWEQWRRDRQLEAEGWEDLRSEMAESGELWCEEVGWGH